MIYDHDVNGTEGNDVFDNRTTPVFNTYGRGGNDSFITDEFANFIGGPGNDTITGGAKGATAVYWDAPKGVYVDLAAGYADDGWGTRDTLKNITWIQASSQDDVLIGDSKGNVIWPSTGHDTIDGGGAIDKITLTVNPADVTWTHSGTKWHYAYGGTPGNPANTGDVTNVEYVNFYYGGKFSADYRLTGSTPSISVLDQNNPTLDADLFTASQWQISQFGLVTRALTQTYGPYTYADSSGNNTTYPGGTYMTDPSNAAIGDFNGDGKQDVWISWDSFPDTVASISLAPSLLLNTGGQLAPVAASQIPTTLSKYFPYRTVTADFNGDGVLDIAYGSMGRMNSQLPPNDQPRSSAEPNGIATYQNGSVVDLSAKFNGQASIGSDFIFAHDASAGDLNSDGKADFFAGGRLWVSNSLGTWDLVTDQLPAALPRQSGSASIEQPMSSAIGDLNSDGRGDLVVSVVAGQWPNSPGETYVLLSNGSLPFPNYTVSKLPPLYYGDNSKANSMALGDLNGDGLLDIVIGNTRRVPYYQGAAAQVYIQTSPGVFEDQSSTRIDNAPNDKVQGEGSMFLIDANGDGLLDIVHSVGGHGADIYLNKGNGYFSNFVLDPNDFPQSWDIVGGTPYSRDPNILSLYPIDINGDGLYDFLGHLAVGTSSSNNANVATLYTAISSEEVWGRNQSENLVGTKLNDLIRGYGGNDTVQGGNGNDTLDGGAGIDTFVLSSKRANYTVTKTTAGYSIKDNVWSDGTDTVTNIEQIKFSDMTINLTVQAKAASIPNASLKSLTELYIAFFNRVPDADGISYWIDEYNSGKTLAQISETFYDIGASDQYSSKTKFSTTMSNTDFINVFYKNVLGRPDGADTDGLAYWGGELASGRSTRWTLAQDILNAAHTFKGNATWGWVADLLDNKVTVGKTFAVDDGITYTGDVYTQCQNIAAAVKSTGTTDAIALIGVTDAPLG